MTPIVYGMPGPEMREAANRDEVEIDSASDHMTLQQRRGWDPDPALPELDDAKFLSIFEGLRTIVHWPDMYGTWCDLDDPDDRPTLIG